MEHVFLMFELSFFSSLETICILEKENVFLVLLSMYHTDKYNIQCVDKTVKCTYISELQASVRISEQRQNN